MRRISDINNKYLSKKILRKHILISIIVIFLLLELLFLTIAVTSSPLMISLDSKNETTESDITSYLENDTPIDSGSNLVVEDDKLIDSTNDLYVVDDTTIDYSSNSLIIDETTIDSDSNLNIEEDSPTDFSNNSIVDKDLFYSTSNERIVPTDEIVSITEYNLGDLSTGIISDVNVENFKDIDNVKFIPTTNLYEVKITVIKLKDKPEEIIDPPKKNISIYKYLDIKLIANDTYVEEDEIKSLEFKFKVEKTWININKIDKTKIKLIRYHDSEWQNLSTIRNSENETYIFYIAESPGFSTFAVVGSEIIEKSESYVAGVMNIPWFIIFVFIILLIVVLVVILFKARYIYQK